ncbi:MAG: hypothetical protein J0H01_29835 [Rhizobiales bacterium]|nr:hypothetical protein [Hyphomicrobiales bacterium]
MRLRGVVLAVGGAEAVLLLVIAANGLMSRSDPATRGLDVAAGVFALGVFAISALPALVLAFKGKALWLALVLCLIPFAALGAAILWWILL